MASFLYWGKRRCSIFFFLFSLLFGNWGGSGELGKCLQYLHRLSTNLAQRPTESFSFDAQVSGFQYWIQVTFSVQMQWSTVFSPFSILLWLYPLRPRDLKLYCRRILKNISFSKIQVYTKMRYNNNSSIRFWSAYIFWAYLNWAESKLYCTFFSCMKL